MLRNIDNDPDMANYLPIFVDDVLYELGIEHSPYGKLKTFPNHATEKQAIQRCLECLQTITQYGGQEQIMEADYAIEAAATADELHQINILKKTQTEGSTTSRTWVSEKPKIVRQYTPHTPTDGEKERNDAIRRGQNAIVDARDSWRHEFSLYDVEDILPAAIAAKAIESGQSPEDWSSILALHEGMDELLKGVAMPDAVQEEIGRSLTAIILDMVLPANVGSFGGGGGNNDLPRKKDDDWFLWKNFGFTRKQRGQGARR